MDVGPLRARAMRDRFRTLHVVLHALGSLLLALSGTLLIPLLVAVAGGAGVLVVMSVGELQPAAISAVRNVMMSVRRSMVVSFLSQLEWVPAAPW